MSSGGRMGWGFALTFFRFTGWRSSLLVTGLMLLGGVLEAVGLILLVPMLTLVTGDALSDSRPAQLLRSLFEQIGVQDPNGRLMLLFACFAVLIVVRAAITACRDVLLTRQQMAFSEARITGIIRALAVARWEGIARFRHARITQALGPHSVHVRQGTRLLQQILVSALLLIAQAVAAVILSPWMALVCAGALALGVLFLVGTMREGKAMGEHAAITNLTVADSLAQYLGGLKLAISQNLQESYARDSVRLLERLSARHVAFAVSQSRNQILFAIVAAATMLLIGGVGLHYGNVEPAVLVGVLVVLVRMTGPAVTLRQSMQQLSLALPSYRELQALKAELAAAAMPVVAPLPIDLTLLDGPITVRNVSFAHRPGSEGGGLRDFSLTIAPGEFLGITGPSGVGKTTLLDLLVGLHTPDSGEIRVNGHLLSPALLSAWRSRVSYVAQESYLAHQSIRSNLLLARPEASTADLWEALRVAGADNLVRAMPAGLDTIAGERGSLMSGGERQRIALARALIRKPRLLILDEATNAVSVASEQLIIGNILALPDRPSIILVAHRPESLAQCDRIVTL